MPAYHSIFLGDKGVQLIGTNKYFKHQCILFSDPSPRKLPAPPPPHQNPRTSLRSSRPPPNAPASDIDPDSESYDILDEVLSLFRANTFFRNFEIKGPADRLLIYGILFTSDCLTKVRPTMDARAAEKALINGALEQFSIPGEPGFPLNQAFEAPRDRVEAETLRNYMSQVRQELASRLHARLYEGGANVPSKWWLSFTKRKFMGKGL